MDYTKLGLNDGRNMLSVLACPSVQRTRATWSTSMEGSPPWSFPIVASLGADCSARVTSERLRSDRATDLLSEPHQGFRQVLAPWYIIPQGLPARVTLEHLCKPLSHDGPLVVHSPLLKSGQRVFPSRSVSAVVPGFISFVGLLGENGFCCWPCVCFLGS